MKSGVPQHLLGDHEVPDSQHEGLIWSVNNVLNTRQTGKVPGMPQHGATTSTLFQGKAHRGERGDVDVHPRAIMQACRFWQGT